MAGFPVKPLRAAFGPTYIDSFKVSDPQKEMGADILNLMLWQLAGVGIVVPKATIFVDATGAAATTTSQLLTWDPTGALSLLTWTRTGTGVYTCQFAATYNDLDGNAIATTFKVGPAWVTENNTLASARAVMTTPTLVEVRTYNAAGAAADLDFGVSLY